MKNFYSLFLSLFFIANAIAQIEEINNSFGELPNLMITANSTVRDQESVNNFDLGKMGQKTCEEEQFSHLRSEFLPSREQRPYLSFSRDKFKIEASMVLSYGSNFQQLTRELENQDGSYKRLGKELSSFIARDFTNYSDREKGMEELCEGKSEKERLALVSQLSKSLAGVYDYARSGGGPNSGTVVSSEMQWNALNRNTKGEAVDAGVCRDATSTVSNFAQKCGFSKDQIRMESIKTAGAGHVVAVIRGSDGKNYNINWSEFFSTESNAVGADPILTVNNVNAGVTVSTYDADGKLRSNRLTEVGAILAANAGSDVSDLNYLPNFNQMRLAAKKVAINVFEGSTDAGDQLQGIGVVGNDIDGMVIGVSIASNERYLRTLSDGTRVELKQKIILLSTEGDLLRNTDFTLINKSGGELKINPSIETDIKFAYYYNKINDGPEQTNTEGKIIMSPGGDISYYDPTRGVTVSLGAKADFMVGSFQTINEQGTPGEKGTMSILPTFTGYQLNGSARFDISDSSTVGLYTNKRSDYFSSSNSIGLDLVRNVEEKSSSVSVGYTRLSDGRGDYQSRSRLVTFSADESRDSGRWRLSVDAMIEPRSSDYRLMTGLSYRFR